MGEDRDNEEDSVMSITQSDNWGNCELELDMITDTGQLDSSWKERLVSKVLSLACSISLTVWLSLALNWNNNPLLVISSSCVFNA